MSRTRQQQQENSGVPPIEVGDVDPMSEARARMNAPACDSESPTGRFCTRIIGHSQTEKKEHPAVRHVHLGPDGTVWEVW